MPGWLHTKPPNLLKVSWLGKEKRKSTSEINMERESGKKNSSRINHNNINRQQTSLSGGRHGIGGDTLRTRSSATPSTLHDTPDSVLQWGNKKRLRCTKIRTKHDSSHLNTARVDRRVIPTDHSKAANFGPPPLRVLGNSENMRGSSQEHGTNGVAVHNKMHAREGKQAGLASANNHQHHHLNNNSNDGVFETANAEGNKKGGGGPSSGSEVIPPAVWPPKFVIALTNKEKEDDFMAIKGAKLPQRPKKRSKYIQRNLKLVSPGAWLCDLTLDRYEVRGKKTSKKRPRGLKAMCSTSVDSDSE